MSCAMSSTRPIAHYIARIGKPPGPMLDDYARRIADGQAWVLEDAARIVGVLVLEETPEGLLLDNIAVPPEHQGKGYGRALMRFAEAEARRRGFSDIHLYTHELMTENIALYTRIGYVETRRISEEGLRPCLHDQGSATGRKGSGDTGNHRRTAKQLRPHCTHCVYGERRAVHA